MKQLSILLSAAFMLNLVFPVFGSSQELNKHKFVLGSIEKIKGLENFYKSENFFFGGQPTYETLQWVKDEGVTLVINLRSDKENTKHTKESFNEAKVVKNMGMSYISIPMGDKKSYRPATVDKFANALQEHRGKVLIHCASCGRVTNLFMAYLIQHKGYTVDEAIKIGKQLRFRLYIEELLGQEISMSIRP